VISIIYVSSAVELFSTTDLAVLLDISRRNNAQREVTGMLLYKDGNFMQVIEGEEANVRDLYTKLQLDRRHTGFLTLLEEKISTRQFGDWSMGFKNLDESLIEVEGFRDYRQLSLLHEAFAAEPSRAKKLLEVFRQKM
jgi:hypothetical protein